MTGRRIKLMADYDCWPLWGMETEDIGNIDPGDLPLTEETVAGLTRWSQEFDARLDRADPARSRPLSPGEEERFEREGQALWRQLQRELGSGFEVYYFSSSTGTLLPPDKK